MSQSNNKRIAKNTLLLYFRMLFIMAVSLYTSRVILDALGEVDFGIYNVVGGVVAMFTMLSGSLSAAISRFITYELGKGNRERLKTIFSTAVFIQIGLGILIFLLIEIIGVWFLNYKMNIPIDRMDAANWVLQISAITFFVNLISVPYNATIIAHERMSAFAYISIIESLGQLGVSFLIRYSPFDRLVYYALLMLTVALVVRCTYGVYCNRHFEESRVRWVFDKQLLKEMFGFAGWNFIGASSALLRDQGGNIIINLFCGPSVNAAKGIATQVQKAVMSFSTNFMTALNPQITKSYAVGNNDYMMQLIFQGARLSFYLLLFLSLPILVNTEYILGIWLKETPAYSAIFVQLALLFALSESISSPLVTAMLATGRIRNYQIVVGGLQMLNLPVAYITLRFTHRPEVVLLTALVISQICLAARLIMLRKMIGLKVRRYLQNVYLNVCLVTIISTIVPGLCSYYTENSFSRLIWLSAMCFISVACVEYYIGCSKSERDFVNKKIQNIISKISNGKQKS